MNEVSTELKHSVTESSSLGMRLRYAREKLGLTQEEIAKRLCLDTQTIKALENDRYQDLPAPVFIKGYVRNYANLVNLSEADLGDVGQVDQLKKRTKNSVSGVFDFSIFGYLLFRAVNYLIILGLITLVILWWREHHALEEKILLENSARVGFVPYKPIEIVNIPSPLLNYNNAAASLSITQASIDDAVINQVLPWWSATTSGAQVGASIE